MATYKALQADVKARTGRTVKTCWIAHVKELQGLSPKPAPNRQGSQRKHPCPCQFRPHIVESLCRFGMLE